MPSQETVSELVKRWVQSASSGTPVALHELCRESPELLSAVKLHVEGLLANIPQTPTAELPPTGPPLSEATYVQQSAPTVGMTTPTDNYPTELGGYKLTRILGEGGMGRVYLAEDERLSRTVAVKVMRPEMAANPEHRTRFLREARSAAALEHDHIITIHQVGEDRQIPFLVMPLLRGESMDARLKREKKLPIGECLRITREIAEGLSVAHQRGLIHRDIKPANVWLEDQRGRVKILDFGLAKRGLGGPGEGNLTQSGAIMGTPAYMAPEQARGVPIDFRADLFSLGCILYESITGVRPFTGTDTMAILTSLAVDNPTDPTKLEPQCPPELAALTMRLLSKKPEERPASAQDLVQSLQKIESLLNTQISSASVARNTTNSWGQLRRHPLSLGIVLVLIVAVVAVALSSGKRPTPIIAEKALPDTSSDDLLKVVAELNRTDPGWRLEEMEAKREVVPADQNGALHIAAFGKIPEAKRMGGEELVNRVDAILKLLPSAPLTDSDYQFMRKELDQMAPALAHARKMISYPRGRFPVVHKRDAFSTMLPDHQQGRTMMRLLQIDSLVHIHDKEPLVVLSNCRAMLNIAQAYYEEPIPIGQLVRIAILRNCLLTLERFLAQCECSEADLKFFQEAYEEANRVPVLRTMVRADRGMCHYFFSALASGDVINDAEFEELGIKDRSQLTAREIRQSHATILQYGTECVGIAEQPPEKQGPFLNRLLEKLESPPLSEMLMPQRILFPDSKSGEPPLFHKFARSTARHSAEARCTLTALAVERYRIATDDWPRDLAILVPKYLTEIPKDPYDGQPLRYRREFDGVSIYCVGPDGIDNQGKFNRTASYTELDGLDIGFQLWDLSKRNRPQEKGNK